jgi:tetratricopeptide (TPR) repeat protein
LAVRPDYLPAQRGLVILEAAMGRSPEALKAARAMQQGRDDNVGYLIEGDFQVSRKNWVAAIDAYRAGLEKRPSSLLAVKLHQAMLAAGKSLDARKMEQEWLHQHPKDVAFLYHLGERSMEMQQYPDALSYFESVRQLLPDDGPTLNNVAWLMHRLKKDGALDIALKATRIGPKIPNFLDTLAEIYADGGQLAKALETQKAAVALDPEIHAHRLHLAHYYLRSGEKSKAKDELSKLLAVGDRFVGQGEVKSLLANL